MDPDLVRLILVVLGVLLVVGIYLWDRYKRAAPRNRSVRQPPEDVSFDAASTDEGDYREPVIREGLEPIPEMPMDPARDGPVTARTKRGAARDPAPELDPEPASLGDWSASARDGDPQFSMELNFDAHGDSDYLNTDPDLYGEVERKIVVINLVARDGVFAGPAIARACAAEKLVLGDMSIYHRHDGNSDRVLFSMASMVEPGSFPGDGMADFTTPGLSLFTQLPGVRDGVVIYEQMLSTAAGLAAMLNAELRDERRNKLTRQMQEHIRESIIEHRRKIKLARSRH